MNAYDWGASKRLLVAAEARIASCVSDFADICSMCADEASRSVVITVAKDAADLAEVMANKRGKYRAYRLSATGGSVLLTNEYTNTAVPLADESIAYNNGANLVVRSGAERRTWKTGKFNWGPVAISSNADASIVAMTKWQGDHRKLFIVDRETGAATLSSFSYYSYVLDGRVVYYALGSGVKRWSLDTGKSETLTGASFFKTLLGLFGSNEPLATVRTKIFDITLFEGRLIASVLLYSLRGTELPTLGRAIISWTPGETDIRIEQSFGDTGMVEALWSNGRTAVASLSSPVGLAPSKTYRRYAYGLSVALIDAGWNLIDVPSLPNHGFQFLPS